jgi:hypothetical protein
MRKPDPNCAMALATANPLVIRPSSSGDAPSESAYSGSSGSMIEMPRLETNEMTARTMSAGPPTSRMRWITRAD